MRQRVLEMRARVGVYADIGVGLSVRIAVDDVGAFDGS